VESWAPGALRELDPPVVSGTRFVWEGLRLLSEEQDGRTRLYVYEDPCSYTPLVRVEGKGQKPGNAGITVSRTGCRSG